jgi:predicted transcriptional regulator YheO
MSKRTADAIFAALVPTLDGIAASFGPTCEVVLHDYRTPKHSVIAVAGSVTGRRVGGAMSEIGLRTLRRAEAATNDVNYLTRTRDGRTVKSSTLPLRDDDGSLIGALCINVDVSALQLAGDILDGLLGRAPAATEAAAVTTFSDDFDDVVDAVVRLEEAGHGKPVAALTRGERIELVARLRERGLFEVRGAAPRIAARLGISRAGLYNDLAAARDEAAR